MFTSESPDYRAVAMTSGDAAQASLRVLENAMNGSRVSGMLPFEADLEANKSMLISRRLIFELAHSRA